MNHLQEVIEKAWDTKDAWDMHNVDSEIREAVIRCIDLLDAGGFSTYGAFAPPQCSCGALGCGIYDLFYGPYD